MYVGGNIFYLMENFQNVNLAGISSRFEKNASTYVDLSNLKITYLLGVSLFTLTVYANQHSTNN